ncbi:MAG: NADP-reducing hydrogenase subunit HndA [bacterium ADurb.Bin429]|nr:MAG: NADP-reducing hydrogenase subunit HndA [bacterium ADurb.Bin429]
MIQETIEQMLLQTPAPDAKSSTRASLVLPLLQRIQREFGYIPAEAMQPVARFTGVPESHVYGVATFYTQFKLTPVGKYIITVCRGTACHVRRSSALLDDLRARLGIEDGETTADMLFTLQTVACVGSCALGPVIVINGKVYGNMTRGKMLKLIDKLAADSGADGTVKEAAQ